MTRWLLALLAIVGVLVLAASLAAFLLPGGEFRPLNF